MNLYFRLFVVVVLLYPCEPSHGAIVQYNTKNSWLAAAGAPTLSENFQGFVSDTSFRTAVPPLPLNGMTIHEIGATQSDVNFVDVAPFSFGSVDGTTNAEVAVDNAPGTASDTRVRIEFTKPASAWGAEFNRAMGGENLDIDVFGNGVAPLGTLAITSDSVVIMGFVANAGETINFLELRGRFETAAREAFSMDNIVLVVPEPGAIALCVAVGAGMALAQAVKRRRY